MAETSFVVPSRAQQFAAEELVGDPGSRILAHATVLAIGSLVAAFVGWAAITPVHEIAVSQGQIVPAGAVQTVNHLEGGIVEAVLAQEGARVEVGQPLLRLSSRAAEANRDQLLVRRENLELQIERLAAFAEDRPPRFAEISTNAEAIADQERLLAGQNLGRDQQETILRDQIANLEGQLAAARERRESTRTALRLIGNKVEMRRGLVEKGYNSGLQLLEAQREHTAATAEAQQAQGTIDGLESSIAETRSRVAELYGRLRQEALAKLETVGAELAEVRQQIAAHDDRVARLVVAAPVRGIVQELPVRTPGGVIQPGGVAARVVPVGEALIAEVQISPRDIGFIRAGQAVKVKIQAFDYARYGRLDGILESVSPTTFVVGDKPPYYLGRVRLAADHVGDRADHLIAPGMTLQADILTGEKTLLQYLLKPIYTTLEGTFGER